MLASDVQVADADDRDRLRFSLTGEAGLNDGTAFPFVLLGLGLLGLHELGAFGWRWFAVDVVWGAACGIGVGAALGTLVGRLVLYLRRTHKEAVGLDNFLALGLIGAGLRRRAASPTAYGFLAVFAAGVALRRIEQRADAGAARAGGARSDRRGAAPALGRGRREGRTPIRTRATPSRPRPIRSTRRPSWRTRCSSFNEQIERIGEVAAVIAVGMLLWAVDWRPRALVVRRRCCCCVIRPLSVLVGLARLERPRRRSARLIGWFGIRGIGSLYYLMYAINHGLAPELADDAARAVAVGGRRVDHRRTASR